MADEQGPAVGLHERRPPEGLAGRIYNALTVGAVLLGALVALLTALLKIPFPPLSWIVGNSLLGVVVLALGGLALLVTVLGILRRPLATWLRIAALVALYAVLVVVVARVLLWPAPSASITAPRTGAEVTEMLIVEGTSLGPVEGRLWIVVRVASPNPDGPDGYFPQEGPIPVEQDRRWKAQIRVGDRNSRPGEEFLVLAVLAETGQAHSAFRSFIATCHSTRCPELKELPDDASILDQIKVVRSRST